jgi:hypothetical protein
MTTFFDKIQFYDNSRGNSTNPDKNLGFFLWNSKISPFLNWFQPKSLENTKSWLFSYEFDKYRLTPKTRVWPPYWGKEYFSIFPIKSSFLDQKRCFWMKIRLFLIKFYFFMKINFSWSTTISCAINFF